MNFLCTKNNSQSHPKKSQFFFFAQPSLYMDTSNIVKSEKLNNDLGNETYQLKKIITIIKNNRTEKVPPSPAAGIPDKIKCAKNKTYLI